MQVSDYAPKGSNFAHVTCEYEGRRYYMGSRNGWVAAETRVKELKEEFPKACFFISDRTSLSVNGMSDDFYVAVGAQ